MDADIAMEFYQALKGASLVASKYRNASPG